MMGFGGMEKAGVHVSGLAAVVYYRGKGRSFHKPGDNPNPKPICLLVAQSASNNNLLHVHIVPERGRQHIFIIYKRMVSARLSELVLDRLAGCGGSSTCNAHEFTTFSYTYMYLFFVFWVGSTIYCRFFFLVHP